jgi:hypothetical protein
MCRYETGNQKRVLAHTHLQSPTNFVETQNKYLLPSPKKKILMHWQKMANKGHNEYFIGRR